MTEKEIDLFADAENKVEEVTAPLNEKMYQVVDLKNGTYQFKRYNGSKSEQRYTSLGYFKLSKKYFNDILHRDDVEKRKIEGNKTLRRAKSDVLTQLDNLLPLLESHYEFEETTKLSDAEIKLAQKYCDEINEKFTSEKINAEIEAMIVILRDLGHITMNRVLTPEQKKLYDDMNIYVTFLSDNMKKQ